MSKKRKFEWTGDLDYDCTLIVGDLMGRAECLGTLKVKGEAGMPEIDYWYCAVYSGIDEDGKGGDVLFHNGEPGGLVIEGGMARAICEAIISARLDADDEPDNAGLRTTISRQQRKINNMKATIDNLHDRLGAIQSSKKNKASQIARLNREISELKKDEPDHANTSAAG